MNNGVQHLSSSQFSSCYHSRRIRHSPLHLPRRWSAGVLQGIRAGLRQARPAHRPHIPLLGAAQEKLWTCEAGDIWKLTKVAAGEESTGWPWRSDTTFLKFLDLAQLSCHFCPILTSPNVIGQKVEQPRRSQNDLVLSDHLCHPVEIGDAGASSLERYSRFPREMRCNGGDITSIQRSCAMQHHAFLPIGCVMITNFPDPEQDLAPNGNILA